MNLREEIEELYWNGYQSTGNIDLIINKILDTAVEAVDSCKSTVYIDGKLEYVVIPLSQAKARLNKLRDEK